MVDGRLNRIAWKRRSWQGLAKAGLVTVVAAALVLGMITPLPAEEFHCPWRISKVGVGKWGNGNKKAGVLLKGSFPVNLPWSTERPDFYMNGSLVGKSQIQTGMRYIHNASSRLNTGDNTITVKFTKSRYEGASHTCTITGFNWDDVPNGGYKWYLCR